MTFARTTLAVTFMAFAFPAFAHDGMAVRDAYIRTTTAQATSGAAFMVIENHRAFDDRLIGAQSDAAERVELHTHSEDANGVMRMGEIEGGILIPAGDEHALDRGGDHLMFLGLTRPLAQGDVITVTLTFELSGELEIEIPVDSERQPDAGAGHGHGDGHGHSDAHGHGDGNGHSDGHGRGANSH